MSYNDYMVSVEQALNILNFNVVAAKQSETLPLTKVLNRVLYKDVVSQINMPPFRQSAMDGYAVNIHSSEKYLVINEVKAGDSHQPDLKPGQATRIFTGAPVPDTANAIIIQEHTSVAGKQLTANRPVAHNANIRSLGEQTKKGDIALKAGTKLNAAGVSFLTSLGFTEVEVYKSPSIGIVVTGNELVKAGQPLKHGQIYESNAIMLASALNSLGYTNVEITTVKDDYKSTFQELKKMINKHDMLLVSGGISVGDYDFVGKVLLELGVEQLFYKVKQKPGKPLFFGKKENSYVFALPGNPASALSCFYVYVNIALQRLSGNLKFKLEKTTARSTSSFQKKGDRAQFLKAIYSNDNVQILEGQNSSMIHTFAMANALVHIPESISKIEVDDIVDVILLPIN